MADRDVFLPHLLARCEEASFAAEGLLVAAKHAVAGRVSEDGKVKPALMEREQRAVHALAWYATYVEALRQMVRWGRELDREKRFGEIEHLILQAAFGEYLAQLAGGIAMSQNEIARPYDLGLSNDDIAGFWTEAVDELVQAGTRREVRAAIAAYLAKHEGAMHYGDPGLDETMGMVREQFFRFAQEKVTPFAHDWHLKDELIPLDVVSEMGALGVFGLTIPEEYGGAGLSKTAMCVVSEELSRGYIGVGSLGTRSEIAAELILGGGTQGPARALAAADRQRRKAADGRLHRTQYGLGSRQPAHARREGGRHLQDPRQQDLDHPCRARRHDDAAGAHRSEHEGLSRAFDAAGRKAARHATTMPFPAQRHDAAAKSKCSAIAA